MTMKEDITSISEIASILEQTEHITKDVIIFKFF